MNWINDNFQILVLALGFFNLLCIYLTGTILFWYLGSQSKEVLRLVLKSNFKNIKMRKSISDEIKEIKKDVSNSHKWPLYVFEYFSFKKENKSEKQEDDQV